MLEVGHPFPVAACRSIRLISAGRDLAADHPRAWRDGGHEPGTWGLVPCAATPSGIEDEIGREDVHHVLLDAVRDMKTPDHVSSAAVES
jgi:hypothetical protein